MKSGDRYITLAPDPSSLIESIREIGYSMQSAVADLIDNSITAESSRIEIRFSWNDGDPWLAIIDNGIGMESDVLNEAMRLGSQSPLIKRDKSDLGRFGLGLKTASFSQARRLTVVSRPSGESRVSGREWDLDRIRDGKQKNWSLKVLSAAEIDDVLEIVNLEDNGTALLWRAMDRMDIGSNQRLAENRMNELMKLTADHLSLVFHRFIAPDRGKSIEIVMNGLALPAFDPFNPNSPATQILPTETLRVQGSKIDIHPFVLPHHTKVPKTEYEKYAGADGYRRSQGFYVYRNRRLIIHGTWFRLAPQDELTKLTRVRIDIPNTLDHLWHIDVRKSKADPPEVVRERLRQVIDRIRGTGIRVYKQRGSRLSSKVAEPLWIRRAANDRIHYELNREHFMIQSLFESGPKKTRSKIADLLSAIEGKFPIEQFYSDYASNAESMVRPVIDDETMWRFALTTVKSLREVGLDDKEILRRISGMDPFVGQDELLKKAIEKERNR